MTGPQILSFSGFSFCGLWIGMIFGMPIGALWGNRRRAYIDRLRADREFAERKLAEVQSELQGVQRGRQVAEHRVADLAGRIAQARNLLGTAG